MRTIGKIIVTILEEAEVCDQEVKIRRRYNGILSKCDKDIVKVSHAAPPV
jgi:hypothetical protein